jgi:hypothetical protein
MLLSVSVLGQQTSGISEDAQTIEDQILNTSNVVLDSAGYPHIAYSVNIKPDYLFGEYVLRYASWTGNSWENQTVDGCDDNSFILALDSKDCPHIVYQDRNDILAYTHWTGLTWIKQNVSQTEAYCRFFEVDSKGNPHICFIEGDKIKYATSSGSDIQVQTVADGNIATLESFALDSHGNPHITYSDNGNLMYASRIDSSWNTELAINGGEASFLAFDSKGIPHMAFIKENSLYYASLVNSNWLISTVDFITANEANPFISSPRLLLDSNNNPSVTYLVTGWYSQPHFTEWGKIKFAQLKGSVWSNQTVPLKENEVVQSYSCVLDLSGNPHLCYTLNIYDKPGTYHDGLGYATFNNGNWTTQAINESAIEGLLIIDKSKPQITFILDNDGFYAYLSPLPTAYRDALPKFETSSPSPMNLALVIAVVLVFLVVLVLFWQRRKILKQ